MTNCKQFKDYILENLSETDKLNFESHMESCDRCQKAFNEEMMIISAFSEVPKVKTPYGFSNKIIDDVHLMISKSFAWKIYAVSIIVLFTIAGFLADFSLNIALKKLAVVTEIANSVGHSVYVAINNISTVLYNYIPANSLVTGVVLTLLFFVTGYVLVKTSFAESEIKKR